MIEKAIYIPTDKRMTKPIIVTIGEEEYVFPPNEPIHILSDRLALIIGNWNTPDIERSKSFVLGRTTPTCPRDRIFRIVENQAINLFETIDLLPPEETKEKEKKTNEQ